MMRVSSLLLLVCLALVSCQKEAYHLEPVLLFEPTESKVESLFASFPRLRREEAQSGWKSELFLGESFLRTLDYYRAISCLRRADFLCPISEINAKRRIEYGIVVAYYLAHRMKEAIESFEFSSLTEVDASFEGFDALILLLEDGYVQEGNCERSEALLRLIERRNPEKAASLNLFHAVQRVDLPVAAELAKEGGHCLLQEALSTYQREAKSVTRARILNAILPGAGYYYVGLKQAAMTSLAINTLFGWAVYQFFDEGYPALALLTLSLELGWYFGGINGAGLSAREYNERLYEGMVTPPLLRERLFPLLQLQIDF